MAQRGVFERPDERRLRGFDLREFCVVERRHADEDVGDARRLPHFRMRDDFVTPDFGYVGNTAGRTTDAGADLRTALNIPKRG
jgi:hypothetical protein